MGFFCTKQRNLYQYLATLAGTIAIIDTGVNVAWTSPYLPQILDQNATGIHATSEEGSWCAIMPLLGLPLGAFVTTPLVDRIGRKSAILAWAPVVLAIFLALAFAKSILTVFAARFVCGAVEGALFLALPMYIAEISDPKVRGKLSGATLIMFRIGTLLINALGLSTSIFTSSLICAVFPVIHFFMFYWMPESPYYYLQKNSRAKAEKSLEILRGTSDVQKELRKIAEAVERKDGDEPAKWSDLFTIASNRKAAMIYAIVTLTNNFSGKYPFQFYTYSIFSSANPAISPSAATIIFCCVEIAVMFMALILVDKFGRRPLFISSTLGCGVSLALEGLYFFLLKYNPDIAENLRWLPVFALVAYNVSFSIGLVIGPIVLLSEIFPSNVKALALSVGATFFVTTAAIASKFFQMTEDAFGTYFPFWCFSACCWFFLPFIVKLVPETKGKTLEEIQMVLKGEKGSRS